MFDLYTVAQFFFS